MMDIWHRVTFNASTKPDFLEAIQGLGIIHKTIESPGGGGMLVFVDIVESSPHWSLVSDLIARKGAANMVETFFTDEEVRNAEWLRLISIFEQGYPQPKAHWPLKQVSRNLLCSKCVIYKQTAPMRLAKEPYLGKKSFMTLIWANEIFCAPEVIGGLEQIRAQGYEAWDAIIHKTDQPSERVRQLYIPHIAFPGVMIEDDLERKICPVCGVTKYYPHVKGVMQLKREALLPDTDFMLTNEWFGHGLLAWQEILVSNRVAQLVLDRGWQGVRFKVVEVI
jgi:hypothetical protein